ncbi:polysaccharide lyase family 3 protein [Schizophyllum commune]
MFSTKFITIVSLALAATASPSPSKRNAVARAASATFPEPPTTTSLDEPMTIKAGESFTPDQEYTRFDRGTKCGGQSEGGDSDAVFLLEDGASISKVVIGADQGEGIHCLGSCTITDVWFEAVCEDAITIKQESGTSTISGGGAKGADDKVIQHNGGGTVRIENYYVEDFGKLYRSCGNCKTMYERHVEISGVTAVSGKLLAGINSNYGDTAKFTSSTASDVKEICEEFEGNDNGDEPTSISTGPSDACIYKEGEDVKEE